MYCTLCVVLNRVSPCPLQRELERQQRQQRLAELTSKAVRHYEHVLLRSRGLKPWRTFVEMVRGQYSRAEAFHEHKRLKLCIEGTYSCETAVYIHVLETVFA